MFRFNADDDNVESAPEKISLDELYERKQKHDLRIMNTFKMVLTRVHNQIKLTSRQKIDQQYCWFVVPEVILSVPSYNNLDCAVYLIEKLTDNGFQVKYTHPNLLLISWQHWVPGYVRKELKKKTGVEIDGHGNYINKPETNRIGDDSSSNITTAFGRQDRPVRLETDSREPERIFKDTKSYSPSGGLVYKEQLLQDLRRKLS